MSTRIVFLGPTLDRGDAARVLDAEYWPPAQRGDMIRALYRQPVAIGIIDGYFHSVRSVWHKEILVALERGVRVYGAASMGALRAAELSQFGMIGVGSVFEAYESGGLTEDDEVAVVHAPAEFSYRPLSVAMVDIRDAYLAAVSAGIISGGVAERLVSIAKAMHYSQRSHPRVLLRAIDPGMMCFDVEGLRRFLEAYAPTLKQRDARAMLEEMARPQAGRPRPAGGLQVERTAYLRALEAEIFAREFPWGRVTGVPRRRDAAQ